MLSRPVLKRLYDFPRAFQYIQATLRQERTYSLVKMTTPAKWKIEKNRILNMTLEDKRKNYKFPGYVAVDSVDPWRNYVIRDKNVETKKQTLDDVKEYKKHVFNPDLDKELSEKVAIYKGDITKLEVDAIVNAANAALRRGGGVDGAIHRAAGPLLQEECYSLQGCETGDAKVSGGYDLPANYVIHTVGPQDGSAEALKSCYERCLSYHQEYKLKSFAFPCISTGIYGFPNRKAAHIALSTTRKFLESNPKVEKVIFCTFLPVDVEIYETLLQMYFPLHAKNYTEGASATES